MGKSPIKILGLSFFYHDAAAALIIDGQVVAAAQEERFSRRKHDDSFPKQAIDFCLRFANLRPADLDYVVFYEKPILKFERLIKMYIKTWPRGLSSFSQAMQAWFRDKLWVEYRIKKELGYPGRILYTEHHYAHAASAYYCSNFAEATVITMDGVGEWDTTTIGYGRDNELKLTETICFPHSLGMLYSALTYYLGFKVNSAEYKVMGLAPYGQPDVFLPQLRELITIHADGSYQLNMKYFAYEYGLTMTNPEFAKLFGGPPRQPEAPLLQRHKDIAAGLQKITEETIIKIVTHGQKQFPSLNLCLAGGVALNCAANGKILSAGSFKNIYVQPAAGDAGGAVGAALYVYYSMLGLARRQDVMNNAFLGPVYSNQEIKKNLTEYLNQSTGNQLISYQEFTDQKLIQEAAKLINNNRIVGWFQGRMEFGPRALGARSIIADPRRPENWQRVNLKIKFRESFRPLAPAVLLEEADKYFAISGPSPYMSFAAKVKRPDIPAVTHIDESARVQTVSEQDNPRFYQLIKEFNRQSNCPVVLNTSLNVRGEPIAESPRDALKCFLNTEMDYLVLGNFIVSKNGVAKIF